MDRETIDYYERHAQAWPARQKGDAGLAAYFDRAFREGGRILDVGCGNGRHLAGLIARGFDARGVDPTAAMRARALERWPELAGRVLEGGLPDRLPTVKALDGAMDGVLCSAVLQHLPAGQLKPCLQALRERLVDGGGLLLNVPRQRPGLDAEHRDAGRRLFTPLPEAALRAALEAEGFRIAEVAVESDPRPEHAWTVVIARALGAGLPV